MDSNIENQVTEPPEPLPAASPSSSAGFFRFVLDVLETLLLAALLFFGIDRVTARVRVDGFSMEPTMHNGEYVLVNRLAYKWGEPQRGDVIVFHPPRSPEEDYIKRIIGLPGDHVRVSGGQVQINGQTITEPYIAAAPRYQSEWTVPEDSLFVLGDNRNNSSDSHSWGPVPMDLVIGKAVMVYWPPDSWGLIEHPILGIAAAP
jgi:signal peptidase I